MTLSSIPAQSCLTRVLFNFAIWQLPGQLLQSESGFRTTFKTDLAGSLKSLKTLTTLKTDLGGITGILENLQNRSGWNKTHGRCYFLENLKKHLIWTERKKTHLIRTERIRAGFSTIWAPALLWRDFFPIVCEISITIWRDFYCLWDRRDNSLNETHVSTRHWNATKYFLSVYKTGCIMFRTMCKKLIFPSTV